jgi:tRNA pseudouridine38-40 synthase
MSGAHTVQLVLEYDGSDFAGWQRQPGVRTVQGVVEDVLQRLLAGPVRLTGAGRTDAGVHARGQAAALRVPSSWPPTELLRALNALLPSDIFVAAAHRVRDEFHPRYSAISRAYTYQIGSDAATRSPFRNRYEWHVDRVMDHDILHASASLLLGNHSFRAFAVQGTAPAGDDHRSVVTRAEWRVVPGGRRFEMEANRFLHHMVRFLVGTMVEAALRRRAADSITRLLAATDNSDVSPPAPPHGLFLERVTYPADLLMPSADA